MLNLEKIKNYQTLQINKYLKKCLDTETRGKAVNELNEIGRSYMTPVENSRYEPP